jgi:outer membrane immunogenic protein
MRSSWAIALAAALAAGACVASPAWAADMMYGSDPLYPAGPVPPQDVFEGWWLGGTLGGATVNYDLKPANKNVGTSGILGGAVGGYSSQSGPVVLGVEGDLLAADISGSEKFASGLYKVSPSIDTMADLRLRAGYAIMPQLLLFGTFGGAWASADLPVSGPGGGPGSADFFGWSVGGGAEVAFNPNWHARFDYQFTDFDSETVKYPAVKESYDPVASTFRGSLIYKF